MKSIEKKYSIVKKLYKLQPDVLPEYWRRNIALSKNSTSSSMNYKITDKCRNIALSKNSTSSSRY